MGSINSPLQISGHSLYITKTYHHCGYNMSGAAVRRVVINTPKAPAAIGAYSQAVLVDKTMYISGQIGFDPKTMNIVGGGKDVRAEAQQALTNMGEILKAAGGSFNNVVKSTVLLNDINDFAVVNEVYASFFTQNFPARAAYQAANLPKGALVEIEAIAVIGDIQDKPMSSL